MMIQEIDSLDALRQNWDWQHIFTEYARPTPVIGSNALTTSYSFDDVTEIVALVNGDNDGPDWVGVFKLGDGRFVSISAGCDYTGWGCQESGDSKSAMYLDSILRFGLSDEDRSRLEVVLPAVKLKDLED